MRCSSCAKAIKFPSTKIGQSAKCPGCGAALTLKDQTAKPGPATNPLDETPSQTEPQPVVQQVVVQQAPPTKWGLTENEYRNFAGKRVTAAVIALFLGGIGIHKFYLGLQTGGLIMLTLSAVGILGSCFLFPLILNVVVAIIALSEFVIYLTKPEENFVYDYAVLKKQWF